MKQRLYRILEECDGDLQLCQWVNGLILGLILLNVFAVIVETVEPIYQRYASLFLIFEIVSIIVFSVEYFARVWISDLKPELNNYRYPRLRYILSISALVDLFAVLPFFAPINADLRFIRILRLFRLVRVMKLGRYSKAVQTMSRVLTAKREEMTIAVSVVLILLLFASTIMYALEHEVQPEAFASIPATMWWGVATLTTVGYGDVYPVTGLGRLFGALTAIFCLGLFALPAGIIASGFAEEIQTKSATICSHCQKELNE